MAYVTAKGALPADLFNFGWRFYELGGHHILSFVLGFDVGSDIITLTTADIRPQAKNAAVTSYWPRGNPPNRACEPEGFQRAIAPPGFASRRRRSRSARFGGAPAAVTPPDSRELFSPVEEACYVPHCRRSHRVKTQGECAASWDELALSLYRQYWRGRPKNNSRPIPIQSSSRATSRAGRVADGPEFSLRGVPSTRI